MKTILVTAYAVNPYKGSEDGMGWNFILQIARYNKVIAVTRCNNKPHIDKYFKEHVELTEVKQRIELMYFDWHRQLIFWKKGPLLSLIYFYCWQLTLPLWLKRKKLNIDIVHNLNFHNDWTPTFLWLLNKPLVWGPVGHHSKIPKQYILPVYGVSAYLQDRFLWILKNFFWRFDPFLYITKKKAAHVLCMNTASPEKLNLNKSKFTIVPSVASEIVDYSPSEKKNFIVLTAGRFVPLKGFDVAVKSFAKFYKKLDEDAKPGTRLILVGSGSQKNYLYNLIQQEGINECTQIIEWLPRNSLIELYKTSSAFLFPSHEGAGMVVAEAMSYGLPVICWKNSGPGEFIHPSSVLSLPYQTYKKGIAGFAGKLELLYSNKTIYQQEQNLSLQRHREYLNWNVRGEQLKKIYDRINFSTQPLIKTNTQLVMQ